MPPALTPTLTAGDARIRRRQALATLAGLIATGPACAWGDAPAVSIKGPLLDGQAFASEALKGQVLLVNFWASWCPPCRAEMPEIEAYYRAHRAQGLAVLALSMDEPADEAQVRELAKGWSFPVAMAQQIKLSGLDRIWRMPVSAVIDRQGKLVKQDWFVQTGLNAALLDAVIKPLL